MKRLRTHLATATQGQARGSLPALYRNLCPTETLDLDRFDTERPPADIRSAISRAFLDAHARNDWPGSVAPYLALGPLFLPLSGPPSNPPPHYGSPLQQRRRPFLSGSAMNISSELCLTQYFGHTDRDRRRNQKPNICFRQPLSTLHLSLHPHPILAGRVLQSKHA